MTNRHAEPSPVEQLTEAVLSCTAPMTQILDHMARSPGTISVAAAVSRLRELLESVLEPLEETVPRWDLVNAAEVVERVTDLIVAEILLVPHAPSAAPRTSTSPRSRCAGPTSGSRRGP